MHVNDKFCCKNQIEMLEELKLYCPVCNIEGINVNKITVDHLVLDEFSTLVKNVNYNICMNENCDVVYYSLDNEIMLFKDQIKVPIWFKKDANPKYACYCSKVSEKQVIDAIINHQAKTIKDVNKITGSMNNANCIENNPLGICCHKNIQEIIDKVLK